MQRYKCNTCNAWFQSKRRKSRFQKKLWQEYVHGKQTAKELADKHGRSRQWIAKQLNEVNVGDKQVISIDPQPVVVVADATFFTRSYGILIFREPNLKINLIWKQIHSESPGQYEQLRAELELAGFSIKGAVLDGKRGVREVFSDVPVQTCQFHQVAAVNRYLTRNPLLPAGQELRRISLSLKNSNHSEFQHMLERWHRKWHDFLKEKTVHPLTDQWSYTHKRIRSAHRSLKSNLPYLFTYQKYPELNLPNTTNTLDGSNTTLKNSIRNHRGLSKEKRYQMICQILGKQAPKN